MARSITILSWNVRGLGDKSKCNNARLAIPQTTPTILFFQESKLQTIDCFKACSFLPATHASSFSFLASNGAYSGGIVTAWDQSCLSLLSSSHTPHSLTTTLQSNFSSFILTVTNYYVPCSHSDKQAFLDDLIELQSSLSDAWVVLGDFNLIRSPDDRSNGNFNHQEAGWFNDAIEAMDLQELPLLDRRFTWSNRQEDPVLVRLDRFFVNTEWSLCLPNSTISSFSAAVSNHCQLLFSATTTIPKPTVFRFNNY